MSELVYGRSSMNEPPRVMGREPSAPTGENGTGSAPIVVRLLRIVKRHKWLLLGSVVVAAILGLIVTMLMTPQYTASATLEIQRETNRIVQVEGVQQESTPTDLEFYQTQYGLLRARTLAERVATSMRLYDNNAFFEMFGKERQLAAIAESQRAPAQQREARVALAADILLDHIGIVPTRVSRLVDVSFTSADPSLSASVVNAWNRHFVEMTLARRFEATAYARRFLEQRLAQLRQRLEESERTLVAYAANQRIINIPSTSTTTGGAQGSGVSTTERPLVAEDLATINRALNEAIAERTAAESRLRASGGSTAEGLQNVAISSLRSRRAELAAEHARMLTQFEPQYPPAVALQNQIRDLDRSITREEGRVRSTIQETYEATVQRENALRARVQQLEGDLLNVRGRSIQYNIYQREVDTNRQLYDALLQRYKEVGVAGGVGVNNISVVDPATIPDRPSSPRLLINLLLSLIIGGAVGAGLALAREQIDEAISDPAEIENILALPLLGTIPKSSDDPETDLEDRKSALVEAYLSTQTRLAFTTDHGIPRTLTTTSTRPGEGKTTTSFALARMLSRTGRKVILIDADMRSPSLHHVFDLKNTKGLSNYLAGADQLDEMVHRGLADGIAVMTAGPQPPNAAELLMGDRVRKLTEELLKTFDHVVLDAPPVMGLADTPLIANQVEGVIFVIEAHETRKSMARVAVNRLRDANARVLGVLLTKFETRRAHYGYGYDYGYSYGYGVNAEKTT